MPDPPSPVFVAMCGIPFSGKSTVACALSERCGYALVSVDTIVTELGIDLHAGTASQHGWARAMAEGFRRSRARLAEGRSVIYDNANHTRRNRDRCRRLADQAGAAFLVVWMDVPVAVVLERLLANRARPTREDVPDMSFREIVDHFEPPIDEPGVIRFQPGMEIDDVIRDIARGR